jgi:hypothetical protein
MRLVVIAFFCIFATLSTLVLGWIFLWLDALDPPDNPLPRDIVVLERITNYLVIEPFGTHFVFLISALWSALLGLIAALIIDVFIASLSRLIRPRTI